MMKSIAAFVFVLFSQCSLLVAVLSTSLNEFSVPASFSINQKKYKIPVDFDSIISTLHKFELDTHLEVVLLGDFDSSSLEHLAGALEQLSKLASSGSSQEFAQEKILFHVSLAKQLESPIVDFLERFGVEGNDNFDELLKIFESYHHKVTATRTLFVTHLSEAFVTHTYVSTDGYAILDIHSDRNNGKKEGGGGSIQPILVQLDTIPPPVFFTPVTASLFAQHHFYDLASLIYRSAEALLPVPLPSDDTFSVNHVHEFFQELSRSEQMPALPAPLPTKVHFELITLCGYPLKQCQPDSISIEVLERFARESFPPTYDSSITGLTIAQASSLVSITNSVPLMSAVLAACQRHSSRSSSKSSSSDNNNDDQIVYFSSEELLSSLSHAPEIRDLVENKLRVRERPHKSDVYLLPIISVLLPDNWEGLLTHDEEDSSEGNNVHSIERRDRFCDRGLLAYGPNMTTFGSTINCHPFKVAPPQPAASESPSHKRFKKLIRSDYHLGGDDDEEDEEDDEDASGETSDGGSFKRGGVGVVVDTALVVLRSCRGDISTTLLPGLVRSVFSTPRMLDKAGTRISRDATYESSELFNAIAQVVWDFPPPHVYFSRSSQQIVTDYLWFESLAWGMTSDSMSDSTTKHVNVNNNNFNRHQDRHDASELNYHLHKKRNFRQSSLFSRIRLFQVVDELLVRAARATHLLQVLGGVAPPPIVSSSLHEGGRDGFGNTRGGKSSLRTLTNLEKETTTALFVTQFQEFLHQMHSVAVSFSHAEYQEALLLARAAEGTLLNIESTLHNSELRASVKLSQLFGADGKKEEMVSVSCREKHSYMRDYHDEEDDEDSSRDIGHDARKSWVSLLKGVLTSASADHVAVVTGGLLGVGGMSGYLYRKGGAGSSRRRYHR